MNGGRKRRKDGERDEGKGGTVRISKGMNDGEKRRGGERKSQREG